MANKPFAIQGAELTLGGVNLQAGTTGVVIPGVTQAVNYTVEEVNDNGDQTVTFQSPPIVIDYVTFNDYDTNGTSAGRAEYIVEELDDDDYIDDIEVTDQGIYTSQESDINDGNDLFAYTGSAGNPFVLFVPTDWTQIPFRPKMRAGEVENIGGGADTGDVVFSGSVLEVGGVGFLNLETGNNDVAIGSNGPYPLRIDLNEGDKEWTFGIDGSLTFPDGSIQTTAYTGQSGGTVTTKLWVAAGASPGGSAILHSTDGINWTPQDFMMGSQEIRRVAISSDRIVYIMTLDGPGTAIYHASAPEDTPTMAVDTDIYGPGARVYWGEINYLGGKFVAVGYWEANGNTVTSNITAVALADVGRTYPRITLDNVDYDFSGTNITITGAANTELNGTFNLQYNNLDTRRTGVYELRTDVGGVPTITSTDVSGATMSELTSVDGSFPVFAYSTNGVSWTYGDINFGYIMEVGGPVLKLEMSDVAYDGTGYLIPVVSNTWADDDPTDNPFTEGPGAFYITDLTAQAGELQFIPGGGPNSLPGNFNNIAAYADGTFFVSDDQYTVWTGNFVDGWTDHNIILALVNAYGWEPDFEGSDNNDVDSATAGTVGGTEYWVGTTNSGMVVSTSDQCDTFQVSIPNPLTSAITDIVRGTTTIIQFATLEPAGAGEKIVITGVTTQEGEPGTTDQNYNGTYYIKYFEGDYELYTDQELTTPLDTTGYWPVNQNTGTLTWGHGSDLDDIHIADGVCIVYSSTTDKLYRSTDLINWTAITTDDAYDVNDIYFASRSASTVSNTLVNGDQTFTLNDNGFITFPDGSVQTTAYRGDSNIAGIFITGGEMDSVTTPTVAVIDGMPYGGGEVVTDTAFGPSSSRVTLYADSMFAIVALNADINTVYYNGETGADGGGVKAVSDSVQNYREYYARRNLFKDDDLVVSQIVISKSSTMTAINRTGNTNNDDFTVSGLAGSDTVIILNVYWANGTDPYNASITAAVEQFIDLVMFDGSTPRTDIEDIRTAFYEYSASIKTTIQNEEGDNLESGFDFYEGYHVVTPTGGAGTGAVLEVDVFEGSTYDTNSILVPGTGYEVNDTLTVLGTVFGGTTPANDATITVTTTDSDGGIDGWSISGTRPTVYWPMSYIFDGDNDQYDVGNFIGTDRTRVSALVTHDSNTKRLNIIATDKPLTNNGVGQYISIEGEGTDHIRWALEVTESGDSKLVNGDYQVELNTVGTVVLPAGGTISEGIVTSNPTIQLTPASPTVASQKLVIKGGSTYNVTNNGITLSYNDNTAVYGDERTFYVYSETYADQTLYWWIYPENAGLTDPSSGTVIINEFGNSDPITFTVDDDNYEFTLRVSPVNNQYDPASIGVESGLINGDLPTYSGDHHLHLTTGNLAETSIFLGTDDHNVRTTTDGNIQITTSSMANNVWTFDQAGEVTFPDGTKQTQGLSDRILITDQGDTIEVSSEIVFTHQFTGLIAVASGDYNYNVRFNAATGDMTGNTYAIGDADGDKFVMAFNPDSTLKWSVIVAGDNGSSAILQNIVFWPISNELVIGYNSNGNTGVARMDPADGSIIDSTRVDSAVGSVTQSVVYRDINATFIGGAATGEVQSVPAVTARTGSTATGTLVVNWADIGSPSFINQYYTNLWAIDIARDTVYVTPSSMCRITGLTPVQYQSSGGSGLLVDVFYGRDEGRQSTNKWYYENPNTTAVGIDYVLGDFLRIPGSQLDGVDSTIIYVPGASYTLETVGMNTIVTIPNSGGDANLSQLNNTNFRMWAKSLYGYLQGNYSLTGHTVTRDATNTYVTFVGAPDFGLSGDLAFVDVVNGNDMFGMYENGFNHANSYNDTGAPNPMKVRFEVAAATDFTAFSTWDLQVSLASQAFIVKLGETSWYKTLGGVSDQKTHSIATNIGRNEVYMLVEDRDQTYKTNVLVLDYTTGALESQFYIGHTNSDTAYKPGTILASGDYVYVIGRDGDGRGLVTKLDMANNAAVIWQRIHDDANGQWDGRPVGAIAGDGNIVVAGVFWEDHIENDDVIAFWKLNADTGAVMFKTMLVDRAEDDDFFEYDEEECQPFSIVNGYMYYGSYIDDDQEEYDEGVAFKIKDDGTGFGTYGRYEYMANESPLVWRDSTANAATGTYGLTFVDELVMTIGAGDVTLSGGTLSVIYRNELISRPLPKITFLDDSDISTAGIARHSVDTGDNSTTLSVSMNGKFIYYNNPTTEFSSTILIPGNSAVALPIGFTVTLVITDFNGYNIFVVSDDVESVTIFSSGTDTSSDYWMFGAGGNNGIYTIMKVDTDTWMLAGPDVTQSGP